MNRIAPYLEPPELPHEPQPVGHVLVMNVATFIGRIQAAFREGQRVGFWVGVVTASIGYAVIDVLKRGTP